MICDLAETYHVLNYRELSPNLVATLVLGLREDSRVKKHYNKQNATLEQMLLATIADNLRFIAWTKTRDGQKNRNKPKSITEKLLGTDKKPKDDLVAFDTAEEYEAYMKEVKRCQTIR